MKNNYKHLITQLLNDSDLDVKLDLDKLNPLAGGVVSLILSTENSEKNHDHKDLVIKHTPENIIAENGPFGGRDQDTLLAIAPKTHELDLQILSLLQDSEKVIVPTLIWGNAQKRTTIMRDYRSDGFVLLQDLLVTGNLDLSSSVSIGKSLSSLLSEMKRIDGKITQIEKPLLQAEERLDELLTFLRPEIELFRVIQKQFLSGNHIVPTDGHPKNLAINDKNECIVFDFGRSVVADPQYVAPNFAAHIGLATVGGCFTNVEDGIEYIKSFIDSFNNNVQENEYKINELWFVRYFTAELLHRGLSGRWIDQRIFAKSSLQEVERAIHDICIEVFRSEDGSKIEDISSLLELISDVAKKVQQGNYKNRR